MRNLVFRPSERSSHHRLRGAGRPVARLLLLGLLIGCSGDGPSALIEPTAPEPSIGSSPAVSRYIVILAAGTRNAASVTTTLITSFGLSADFVYAGALNGFAATMADAAARQLAANPLVQLVEPDQVFQVDQTQSPTPSWGLDRVDQRTLPLDASYTFNVTGAGERVHLDQRRPRNR